MQIKWVCGISKSTIKKSTECQPGWKHKITLSESVSRRPNLTPTFLDKNTFLCRNCTAHVESFCVEIACVEVTDTLDT